MHTKMRCISIFLLLCMAACTPKAVVKPVLTAARWYQITDSMPNDMAMNGFLASYKAGKDSIMNRIVGSSILPLTKAQPECSMGYFVADAQLWKAREKDSLVNISILGQGSLRTPYVASGNLKLGSIYEIMPFDNMIAVAELPGSLLDSLCQHIAAAGGWPVSGLQFAIRNKQAENILVNGKPIHPQHIYRMACSDYLLNGGDNCDFLRGLKRKEYNVFLRDAMLEYLAQLPNQTLDFKLEQRIVYAD